MNHMVYYLIILFTLLPIAELVVILQFNNALSALTNPIIGTILTVITVLGTGVLGAWLAKQQGLKTLAAIQESLARGQMPTDELIDGAIIIAGGVMLLAPGFISDVVGIFFLAPPTRLITRAWLKRWFKRQFDQGRIFVRASGTAWFSAQGFGFPPSIKRINPDPPSEPPPPQP